MKKTLLLAGVACLFSFGANAADYNMRDLRPYIGIDYIYTNANIKKETGIKKRLQFWRYQCRYQI